MPETKALTANIVVDERLANIFNLMKGALGCRNSELFEELLEFYLENRFQSRLDDRAQMFINMIERLKEEREAILDEKHGAEATVEIHR